jgi:general secretion pathway protein G
MPKKMPRKNGFTLIELLIVILVIGALSGILLGIVNSSGVRGKARDSERKSDITKMQTALELYFADYRTYPVSPGSPEDWEEIDGSSNIESALEPSYLDPVPMDPKYSGSTGNANPCSNADNYRYNYKSDGATYQLTAIMEIPTSHDASPCTTANTGCSAGFATESVCYFAQNP